MDVDKEGAGRRRRKFHPVYLLLLIPYIALLWVPFYNRIEPTLFGIPFFYWFQMLWIAGGVACLYPVYAHEERRRQGSGHDETAP